MTQPSDFDKISADIPLRDHSAESEAKAKLESELLELKARFRVERGCNVIALVVFFDVIVFERLDNWASVTAILILELMYILLIAKAYDINHMHDTFTKVVRAVRQIWNPKK